MDWIEPAYKREHVNEAGRALVASMYTDWQNWNEDQWSIWYKHAEVINNWRASHAYPLLATRLRLSKYAEKTDGTALVAQRIKRFISIAQKLNRLPAMKLTQMQDIGGCRAVVGSMDSLRKLVRCYTHSRSKHEEATCDDYIQKPRASGYRDVHFVYRYRTANLARKVYDGLKIEVQLRTQYQHAWATTVETVGTFTGQALKSSLGSEDWLRFFQIMGTTIAVREDTPRVPSTPDEDQSLIAELQGHVGFLNVEQRLIGFRSALQRILQPSAELKNVYYYLLQLDIGTSPPQLSISGFKQEQEGVAQETYLQVEKVVKQSPGKDAVLVSVDSLTALERAYPNYFADSRVFLELMHQTLTGEQNYIPPPALLSMTPASETW
jgi:ppGpp synthetase/RelA/SpoT-type nucleotidyltranferase